MRALGKAHFSDPSSWIHADLQPDRRVAFSGREFRSVLAFARRIRVYRSSQLPFFGWWLSIRSEANASNGANGKIQRHFIVVRNGPQGG